MKSIDNKNSEHHDKYTHSHNDVQNNVNQSYKVFGTYRFILAIFVVMSHASAWCQSISPFLLGNIGVLSFFVLSGFVIAEAIDIFYKKSIFRYAANRFLKIYPGYWCAAIMAVLVGFILDRPLRIDTVSIIANITIIASYFHKFNGLLYISIAWAVVTELIFYILYGAFFLVKQKANIRYIIMVLLAICLISVSVSIELTAQYYRWYSILRFSPYFICGVTGYFILAKGRNQLWWIMVPSLGAMFFSFWSYQGGGASALPSFVVFVISLALFGILATVREVSPKFVRLDRRLGDYTYAIYLCHMPVIDMVTVTGLSDGSKFAVTLAVSIAVGMALNLLVERPVARLRNKVRKVSWDPVVVTGSSTEVLLQSHRD
ncbi:acyltransferase [Magnetospirillum sp. 15-1]|uniref:acyltransferase family protein n=1 Tax=Magnetospirillum sp. 15-1 TaxID=1979370 RepID=UPI000BBCCF82|nr:acyltransferase [Magnetospirillum sp. 15-1]